MQGCFFPARLRIFQQNIIKLIELAKKHTTDIIFIGLVLGDDSLLKPFPESSKGESYDHKRAIKYDNLLKNLVESNNCKYIYLYDKLLVEDFIDGLHPNEKGHLKMYEVIKEYFL